MTIVRPNEFDDGPKQLGLRGGCGCGCGCDVGRCAPPIASKDRVPARFIQTLGTEAGVWTCAHPLTPAVTPTQTPSLFRKDPLHICLNSSSLAVLSHRLIVLFSHHYMILSSLFGASNGCRTAAFTLLTPVPVLRSQPHVLPPGRERSVPRPRHERVPVGRVPKLPRTG